MMRSDLEVRVVVEKVRTAVRDNIEVFSATSADLTAPRC